MLWLEFIIVLLAILFIIMLIIKRFVYFHPTYEFMAPKDTFLELQEGNLHAWFKQGSSDKVILFCHGNAGNISHRQDKIMEFSKMGHSSLIFDYSGYGHSRGVPNEQMFYFNADTFFAFLVRKGYQKENIIPFGESMGAAVAMYTARKYQLPKVIIESGLPGINYVVRYKFPKLWFLSYVFNEFDTVKYLDGYKGKSLVLHCINDEIVPFETTKKMRELATQVIEMDGSHNAPIIPWDKIKDFVE